MSNDPLPLMRALAKRLKTHALESFRTRHMTKHGNARACADLEAARRARNTLAAAEWSAEQEDRERGSVPAWFASEYPNPKR